MSQPNVAPTSHFSLELEGKVQTHRYFDSMSLEMFHPFTRALRKGRNIWVRRLSWVLLVYGCVIVSVLRTTLLCHGSMRKSVFELLPL